MTLGRMGLLAFLAATLCWGLVGVSYALPTAARPFWLPPSSLDELVGALRITFLSVGLGLVTMGFSLLCTRAASAIVARWILHGGSYRSQPLGGPSPTV